MLSCSHSLFPPLTYFFLGTKKDLFIFILWVRRSQKPEEGTWSLRTGVTEGCELLWRCWEPNPGPLQEQRVPLTTKPFYSCLLSPIVDDEAIAQGAASLGKGSYWERGEMEVRCWSCSPGSVTHRHSQRTEFLGIPLDAVLWLVPASLNATPLCFSSWFAALSAEHFLALPVFSWPFSMGLGWITTLPERSQ